MPGRQNQSLNQRLEMRDVKYDGRGRCLDRNMRRGAKCAIRVESAVRMAVCHLDSSQNKNQYDAQKRQQ